MSEVVIHPGASPTVDRSSRLGRPEPRNHVAAMGRLDAHKSQPNRNQCGSKASLGSAPDGSVRHGPRRSMLREIEPASSRIVFGIVGHNAVWHNPGARPGTLARRAVWTGANPVREVPGRPE